MDEALRCYHSAHLSLIHYNKHGEPWLDQFRLCPVYDEHGRPSGHFVGISTAIPLRPEITSPLCPPGEDLSCEPSRWLQPDLLDMLDEELNGTIRPSKRFDFLQPTARSHKVGEPSFPA